MKRLILILSLLSGGCASSTDSGSSLSLALGNSSGGQASASDTSSTFYVGKWFTIRSNGALQEGAYVTWQDASGNRQKGPSGANGEIAVSFQDPQNGQPKPRTYSTTFRATYNGQTSNPVTWTYVFK